MKKSFFLIFLILAFFITLQAKEFITIYNVKLFDSQVDKKSLNLWTTLKGKIIYNIKNVNYYRLIEDNSIVDVKINFSFPVFINSTNFKLQININSQTTNKLVYLVKSKSDYENFPDQFIKDLKLILPLRGIIFDKNGLAIKANIGKYYSIKKGDSFFIVNNNKIKGIALVDNSDDYFSDLIITSYNTIINTNDLIIPFTYELNLNYKQWEKTEYFQNIKDVYKFSGLYGNNFIIKPSKANYIFLADEKEAGLFENKRNFYEQLEKTNFNYVDHVKFSLNELYCGYLLDSQKIKIINLNKYQKYLIKLDPDDSSYHVILQKEVNTFPYTNIIIKDFAFYQNNSVIFYDQLNKKIIKINLENGNYQEIKPQTLYDEITKLSITQNNKKLIITADKDKSDFIIIYDLENNTEYKLNGPIGEYKISKDNIYLLYKQNKDLHYFNLYHFNDKTITLNHDFNQFYLSASERYLFFLNSINNNQLNYYDNKLDNFNTDVFNPMKLKYIKKIQCLNNDQLLLYGQLFDLDNNNKLDYRDLNSIVYFNFIINKYQQILNGIDDFLGLSNYGSYIIYRNNQGLYLKKINYGQVLK